MPIIETDFVQKSDRWFKARLGSPGASSMDKIITSQGKPSKSRQDYLFSLAAETVRGKSDDTFRSNVMLEGEKRENEARSLFEFLHNVEVQQVAMVYKDEEKLFHISPDGLIGSDSGIEIKCPLGKTQTKYLLDNKLPTNYFVQIQSSLYVCERKFWWFMSYVDGLKPFIVKVERDEKFITKLETELKIFTEELKSIITKIK